MDGFESGWARALAGRRRRVARDLRRRPHIGHWVHRTGPTEAAGPVTLLRLSRQRAGFPATAPSPGSYASRFQCEGSSFKSHWLDARLNDFPQPKPGSGSPERDFDLGIGQWRQVNLVIKEPSSADAFLFTNDSYNFPRASNPSWRLPPGEYVLTVVVDGSTSAVFRCTLANKGASSSLAVISSEGDWSLPELVAKLPS